MQSIGLDGVEDLIKIKVDSPMDMQGPYTAPSRTPRGRSNLGAERLVSQFIEADSSYINAFYDQVLGWMPANPSKEGLADAIKSVYVFSKRLPTDPVNLVNTPEGHRKFSVGLVSSSHRHPVFLVAPKGTGKTFYLNYLINTEHDYLYENKKVWYRCDVSKLYKLNINQTNKNSAQKTLPITLRDYFDLHIAYVTFKYRNDHNKVFQEIWNDKNAEVMNLLIDKWSANKDFRDGISALDELPNLFMDFINQADRLAKRSEGLTQEKLAYLIENGGVLQSNLLSQTILAYLAEKGFQPVLIIDGLDNIDYFEYETEYHDLIKQVRTLCFTDDKENFYKARFVLSLRDETFAHLGYVQYNFSDPQEHVYRIKLNKPSDILHKKINVAIEPQSHYFTNLKKVTIDDIEKLLAKNAEERNVDSLFQNNNDSFMRFAENFLGQFADAINKVIPQKSQQIKDEIFIFDNFYNGNLRVFLRNYMNIYRYYKLWQEKKTYIGEGRSYILTEGQLLNGSLYLDSKEHPFEFGKCIPNIFFFDAFRITENWHGLCLLRILQLLRFKKQPSEQTIFKFIRENFRYDIGQIKQAFYSALSYGLIKCEISENLRSKHYQITDKGLTLLDYSFYNIDIFYHLALDTPLSQYSIDRTMLTKTHSNTSGVYWESYSESCVLTSITLIRHILTQHKKEMESLKKSREIFTLPHFFPKKLIEDMKIKMEAMKSFKDKSRLGKLIDDIAGITEYSQET